MFKVVNKNIDDLLRYNVIFKRELSKVKLWFLTLSESMRIEALIQLMTKNFK